MQPTPPPMLDPAAVAVLLALALFDSDVAAVIGPYSVIIIAATTGAAWALSARPASSRAGAVLFFLRVNATAALLTAGIAEAANDYIGATSATVLFAPVALFLGGIGHRWPDVLRWALGRVQAVIDSVLRSGGPK